ncbi:hypothetical protein BJ973_002531 [Actinoplanes tereljensis]|uniref:hypothetical protein n=1 Tax=Paractinoplanes tereljensis TaxID=571912 RepID=UPI001940877F|nr:hypothetical protein [Actinoplanes tereljensis]
MGSGDTGRQKIVVPRWQGDFLPRRIMPSRLTLTDVERRGQFAYLTHAVAPPAP